MVSRKDATSRSLWNTSGYGPFWPLVLAVASAAVATLLSLPLRNLMPHSRGIFLFVAIIFSTWFGGLAPGLVASGSAALGFIFFLSGQAGPDWSLEGFTRFAIFGSAMVAVTYLISQRNLALYRMTELKEELEQALNEIHVLRGILPVCMHCKQIRNDSGRWQEMEVYISERTDTQFSHGVCPKCLAVHYPESVASR